MTLEGLLLAQYVQNVRRKHKQLEQDSLNLATLKGESEPVSVVLNL